MKLRFLFLLSLLCIFMLFGSVSFAGSMTWDTFIEFNRQASVNATGTIKSTSAKIVQYISKIQSGFSNNNINITDYDYFFCNYNPGFPYGVTVWFFNGNGNMTYASNKLAISGINGYSIYFYNLYENKFTVQGVNARNNYTYQDNGSTATQNNWGLIYNQESYGNFWFNNMYVPPYTGPEFEPVNNGKIEVFNSNKTASELMNRLPFSYNGEIYWTLGYITNFDGVKNIEGYFGPLVYDSGDTITDNSLNSFSYDYYYGVKSKNLYFDKSSGRVAINKNALLNKQAFNLILSYQEDFDSGYEYFADEWYYSYFYNLYLTSGDSISSDMNSTVDIGFVGAINDLLSPTSGDLASLDYDLNSIFDINGAFSGDFLSGDFLYKTGYNDYTNNEFSVFIFRQYRNLIGCLQRTYNPDSSVTFSYRGNNFTYYARDFYVPDSGLKSFIRNFLICAIFIFVCYQIHRIIIAITTLDVHGFLTSFDRDHTLFM